MGVDGECGPRDVLQQLGHRYPSGCFGAVVLVRSPTFAPEVVDSLEPLVHTGEAQVRHLIDDPEPFEHGDPHLFGGRF